MRALFIIALLLSTIPANASDRLCVIHTPEWDGAYHAVDVPHDTVVYDRAYTAVPPATLFVQEYTVQVITYTHTITVTEPPPPHTETHTHTIPIYTLTETVQLLGHAPFITRAPEYAYHIRSRTPFRFYDCPGHAQPHTFLPLVHSPTVNTIAARRPIERGGNTPRITE